MSFWNAQNDWDSMSEDLEPIEDPEEEEEDEDKDEAE